jgi:hypothetical protein
MGAFQIELNINLKTAKLLGPLPFWCPGLAGQS